MASASSSEDKFFEKVFNPYLPKVMKNPQTIEMRDGVLHIRYVHRPKKMGTMEPRLEVMEEEVFKCQGMVERGLSANHSMIMEFTRDLEVDGRPLEDIIFTLNDQFNFLQDQVFYLQYQIFEYEERFKGADVNLRALVASQGADVDLRDLVAWQGAAVDL
ncbi:40S ribosomal protein S5-1 [Hordeum vulgare]|nr:40S ribosomal protein S5-1 [Hordeum vulgare]